ncbi:MAG: phage portal protein, partial [Eggerthellaceae bacterium]|nr:phage portal protein [Eggerthellaceae bacterium]
SWPSHSAASPARTSFSKVSPARTSSSSVSFSQASISGSSRSAGNEGMQQRSQNDGATMGSGPSDLLSHGNAGTYKIVTVLFDEDGNIVEPAGVCAEYDTGSPFATFSIVKPAVDNTRVDMSPYGQSVFADAIDAIKAVDEAFDSVFNEISVSKMRIFLSDVLFDKESSGTGKKVTIPFGKNDCTVFRKVMSTEDMIQEFAPALRTSSQVEAFRIALQMLGDLTGFGLSYFDIDDSRGYLKTATEVASDSSALMRNVARHEHALEQSIAGICRALLCVSRCLGESIPEEGSMRVDFDDSIVTDTAAEKRIAMSEVGVTMHPWEYRARFFGEDEETARERAKGLGKGASERSMG